MRTHKHRGGFTGTPPPNPISMGTCSLASQSILEKFQHFCLRLCLLNMMRMGNSIVPTAPPARHKHGCLGPELLLTSSLPWGYSSHFQVSQMSVLEPQLEPDGLTMCLKHTGFLSSQYCFITYVFLSLRVPGFFTGGGWRDRVSYNHGAKRLGTNREGWGYCGRQGTCIPC